MSLDFDLIRNADLACSNKAGPTSTCTAVWFSGSYVKGNAKQFTRSRQLKTNGHTSRLSRVEAKALVQ